MQKLNDAISFNSFVLKKAIKYFNNLGGEKYFLAKRKGVLRS
jgi:hypothetical protein